MAFTRSEDGVAVSGRTALAATAKEWGRRGGQGGGLGRGGGDRYPRHREEVAVGGRGVWGPTTVGMVGVCVSVCVFGCVCAESGAARGTRKNRRGGERGPTFSCDSGLTQCHF